LHSVSELRGLESTKLSLFVQKGNKQVEKYIFDNLDFFDTITYIAKESDIAAENILFNRNLAYQVAFGSKECELVIFFEEDVEVARDLIEFSIEINNIYKSDKNFHGINYGSVLKHNSINTYSILRYGMHGPASAISRQAWEKYTRSRHKMYGYKHFDGIIEYVLKTGFMVTPNRSLYFDNGLSGSHTGNDDIGFLKQLRESFRIDIENPGSGYEVCQMDANWRYPAKEYKRHLNIFYKLIHFMAQRHFTKSMAQKLVHFSNYP
jgi:hypothetical protein